MKAIGSADTAFRSGESDLRGLVVADGIRGKATVIARDTEGRYAFYRGEDWLGAPEDSAATGPPNPPATPESHEGLIDYTDNLRQQNTLIQRGNYKQWDELRRGGKKGVQIQKAQ